MNEKLRILIVEDNPADADFIHEMLPQAGPLNFQVESVQRLSEALARLADGGFDLVLLDLGLPDSQGLQTFYTLQKAAPDVPVVVLTGNDDQDLAVAAMREGAQDFLVKGQISGRPLVRTVRFALARRKAEEALRQSELKFRTLVENIPQKIFVKGPDCHYLSMSGNLAREFHIRPGEVAGKTDYDFFPKELADKFREDDRRIMRLGKTEEFDETYLQDDREVWVHTAKTPMRDEDGKIIGVLGIFWDISGRKQAENNLRKSNRALRLISLCNQEMVRATDETALMQAVCRLAVEPGGYRMAWVGFAEQDEAKSVRPVAQAGLVDGYLDNVNITWADVENGRGPTGTAIRTGKPVYISNMLTEPAFAPWREAATRRGYASSIALPMMTEGRCFGALMIYAGQPDAFDTEEIELLSELAGDLAFGVAALRQRAERKRAEVALRESEASLKEAQNIASLGRYVLDISSGRWSSSDLLDRLFGIDKAFNRSVEGWTTLIHPADRAMMADYLKNEVVGRKQAFDREYRIVRHDDQAERWVHGLGRIMLDDQGRPVEMHGTIQDITERKLAAQRVADELNFNQTVLRVSPVGILVFKASGSCVSANETIAQIVGGPREAVLNQNFRQLESWKNSGMLAAAEAALAGQKERDLETQCVTTFGRQGWFFCRFAPFQYKGEQHLLLVVNDITEHKRAELELKRERDLWQTLLDHSPDKIYFKDTQSRFVKCSRAMADQFGVKSPDELVGRTDFDFFDESHARPAFEDEQEIIRTGRPMIDKEEREESKDGRVTWVASTKLPWLDDAGKIIGIMGISRDVTGRKLAEDEIIRTAREWQTTFDAAKDAIWILDQDNRILRTNKAAEKYFSRPCCDMMGKPCWEIAHGTTEPIPNCPFVRAHKSHQREMMELHQGDCWLEITVDPITDAEGRLAGAVHIVSDITARKRAEQQMKEALDFNRAIIADAAVGIVVFKASGPCVLANEAAAKILGGTVSGILGQDFRQFISWHSSGKLQMAEEVLATKKSRQWEGTLITMFGREVSLVSHFSHFIQNGEPHLLQFLTDVTEKKKLEAQFLRAQRMESIGTLAGGIAHDLNNVLAPLLISVQLLGDKVTDADGRRMLAMLEANVHRGTDLVRQVLAFGRGIQGERVLVQIAHIAREIKSIVQETFPKSVQFQMEIARDLWKITGDATQIEQVLLNLSVNARDAMPDGGKLSLKMENKSLDQIYADANLESKPGRYVVISMTDTGMGMTREVQDRIFEPFFTTKEHGKGTGLGLSTTLAIVKSHGGFIHCYSEPGKGSTFKVYLPAGDAPDVQAALGKAADKLPRGHNELVLVVDDEEPIRRVAKQVLESFGYRTLSAVNGVEAVKIYKARKDEIAVVITDMAMPVMDGPATIAALRAINPRIRIIATSGLDSGNRPGAAIRPFIAKPYTADGLLLVIQSVLRGEPVAASEKKKTKEKGGRA
jgi:PAS domain S-box-containing protein